MVCLRNICINTLHKGDNDDDNDYDDDDDDDYDDDNNNNNNNNRQNQYYQNKLFRTDCKKFYNRLRHTYPNVNNAPSREEVENFWRKIYEKKSST